MGLIVVATYRIQRGGVIIPSASGVVVSKGGKESYVVALAWAMVIDNSRLGGRLSFSWMIASLDLSREVCGRVS